MLKKSLGVLLLVTACLAFTGCEQSSIEAEVESQKLVTNSLMSNQPTPKDLEFSLERYNLIRRAYWVNGMKEKALNLPCPVVKPLSYVVVMSGNVPLGKFAVDGKVSSLNSFLTPDSEYYEEGSSAYYNEWLADVDGSYGENDSGVFFFSPDGKYYETSLDYFYTDEYFTIDDPIVKVEEVTTDGK